MATIVFDFGLAIAIAIRAGVAVGSVKHPLDSVAEGHVGMLIGGGRGTWLIVSSLTGADHSRRGNGRGGCASTEREWIESEGV